MRYHFKSIFTALRNWPMVSKCIRNVYDGSIDGLPLIQRAIFEAGWSAVDWGKPHQG